MRVVVHDEDRALRILHDASFHDETHGRRRGFLPTGCVLLDANNTLVSEAPLSASPPRPACLPSPAGARAGTFLQGTRREPPAGTPKRPGPCPAAASRSSEGSPPGEGGTGRGPVSGVPGSGGNKPRPRG